MGICTYLPRVSFWKVLVLRGDSVGCGSRYLCYSCKKFLVSGHVALVEVWRL